MREILFRGKAINRIKGRQYRTKYKNGDWVYGLIEKLYDDYFPNIPATMRNTDGVSDIDIDYNTIGQYTGLTDKNGNKIFEGDIVKAEDGDYIFVVKFGKCGGVSNAEDFGYMGFFVDGFDEITKECIKYGLRKDICFFTDIQVIGNIHDNPDLLKGGDE